MNHARRWLPWALIAGALLIVPAAAAQDADADRARSLLETGIAQFQDKQYADAQATLLKVDRDALGDEQKQTLDTYLERVRVAGQMQRRHRELLAGGLAAVEDGRYDEARESLSQAAQSEYLLEEQRVQARRQLDLLDERALLAESEGESVQLTAEGEAGVETPEQAEAQGDDSSASPQSLLSEVRSERLSARELAARGDQALAEGDYPQAVELYERSLEQDPQQEQTRENLRLAREALTDVQRGRDAAAELQRIQKVNREAALVEIQQASDRARELISQSPEELTASDFDRAADAVEIARGILRQNRRYFSATAYDRQLGRIEDLRNRVETRRQEFLLAEQQRTQEEITRRNLRREQLQAQQRERQIATLTEQARARIADRRWDQALQIVEHILRIDPGNQWARDMETMLSLQVDMRTQQKYMDHKATNIRKGLIDLHSAETPWYDILRYPQDWRELSRRRLAFQTGAARGTQQELLAMEKLQIRVQNPEFSGVPFGEVLDYLRTISGANITVRWNILRDPAGITEETLVQDVKLSDVTVAKLLDVVLQNIGGPLTQLAYVVDESGVVIISTKDDLAQTEAPTRVYDITDLIAPSNDYASTSSLGSSDGGGSDLDLSAAVEGGGSMTEQVLTLLRTNIAPDTWRPEGNIGSMSLLNGQLIVKHTRETHRELAKLLSQLREQQAVQVSIEARFISVNTGFLNSIGLDLDMYFNIGSAMGAGGSTIDTVTGAIIPLEGASSDWASEGYSSDGVSRLTPIPLIQDSLTYTSMLEQSTPLPGGAGSFGADVSSPSLRTFGTFLDEIQVDFLLEATQAHQSSRSLAAPRITLSNGNQAYIEVVDEQAYVSDLEPVVAENAVGFEYTVETVESGTKLTVRGTVSADRRYVTLDIKPEVIQLLELETFATIGGFIQLPELSKKTLQTIVSVPDGGTLLLGGLRLTGELEREKGVPLLSKVPYINRFFDNRGMLRDEQTLLILVKPEILIQREEEEDWYPE